MKKLSFILMAAVALIGFSACSSSDDGGSAPEPTPLGTIKKLAAESLGSWDEGFVTEKGVYLLKKNGPSSSAPVRKAPASDEAAYNTETLYFSSADGATKATLLINKTDNRPLQLILKDGVLNFSFLSDDVLELVFKNGSEITYIDQIPYDKAALDAALAAADYKNELQTSLFYFASVTDITKLASYPTVVAAAIYFREIINFKYEGSSTVTAAEAGLTVGSDGVPTVVQEAEQFEETIVEKVYSTITVWTGKASFKVGGSSCTLSGTVFCADPTFAKVGEVGIVCDKNKSKLMIGQAEFESKAELKDDGQNFEVDFRGFSPTTTYYYRAYYKFQEGVAYGDLVLDPAQVGSDGAAYDQTVKEFTTGEYKYTVDVVMLMDISGSMSDELDMVKENAKDFFSLFKGKCDEKGIQLLGLSTQVVTFSDINCDGEEALNESDVYNLLNDDEHDAFETYVNNIYLTGGGDLPESALEALATAFQRDTWGPDDGLHRQIFILWTDATYKTYNESIYKIYQYDENGDYIYDDEGYAIGTPAYQEYSYDQVKAMWDGMPSGRRLIIFAPYGTFGYPYEGDWGLMDEWKNVYHEENSYESFNNFSKSLDYIVDEMIGKEKSTDVTTEGKARKAYKPFVRKGPAPRN